VGNLHQFSHIKGESSFFDFHLSLIVTGANKWRRLKGRNRCDRLWAPGSSSRQSEN
jgi:hypothetical protein